MSRLAILYVDDEPDIREVAEIALQIDPGIDVRTCGSGREAIDIARQWKPALILLDVMMPEMDGPATLAELRSDPETAGVPVIFITARAQPADMRRLKALGAIAVIAKPFEPMELAGDVRRLLGGGGDPA